MNDEIWMRTWNEGHKGFCDDIDRCFVALAGAVARVRRRREAHVRSRIGVPGRHI